ncbi:MAG TPA: hypothetical protein VKY92_07525 [Verrucomicrobiae bacterium]|nr:hypothetical protein [Verrucomicrobiae bacterium]
MTKGKLFPICPSSPGGPGNFQKVTFRRPLLCASTVLSLIPVSRQEDVIALIEDGSLAWAWNIGLSPRNREVRVLAESVNAFLAGEPGPFASSDEDEFNRVLPLIFPEDGPEITAAKIARSFNTGTDHIISLGRAGEIRFVKGTPHGPGPLGSPRFEFASVVNFIRDRRLL